MEPGDIFITFQCYGCDLRCHNKILNRYGNLADSNFVPKPFICPYGQDKVKWKII